MVVSASVESESAKAMDDRMALKTPKNEYFHIAAFPSFLAVDCQNSLIAGLLDSLGGKDNKIMRIGGTFYVVF